MFTFRFCCCLFFLSGLVNRVDNLMFILLHLRCFPFRNEERVLFYITSPFSIKTQRKKMYIDRHRKLGSRFAFIPPFWQHRRRASTNVNKTFIEREQWIPPIPLHTYTLLSTRNQPVTDGRKTNFVILTVSVVLVAGNSVVYIFRVIKNSKSD